MHHELDQFIASAAGDGVVSCSTLAGLRPCMRIADSAVSKVAGQALEELVQAGLTARLLFRLVAWTGLDACTCRWLPFANV